MNSRPLLSIRDLNTFYGRAHILRKMALEVHRGQVTALLGRNGAGKSTTLKAIIGLVSASSGEIIFDDFPITNQRPYKIAQAGIGYVPEERRIFTELTIMENLQVGLQPPRKGAPHWTLESVFEIFPNLANMRNRLGANMSGGEQQMLAIARTLMGNPALLLLDEPSEGLAPKIVEQIAETIRLVGGQGLTVILSEQNLHFASLIASDATIIEKGTVRFSGTMAELRQNEGIQREYLSA
jgi:branched-chain amino acid transport system ATP-binding protein